MKLVKLTKLGRVDEPYSPSEHLQTGEFRIGVMYKEPEIGSRFQLYPAPMDGKFTSGISTSGVSKLMENNIFETYNTIYYWEVIND